MRFFFYGTLIAGSGNPVAADVHARLRDLGPATARGTLHAVPDPDGWYPALLPGDGEVRGRLYEATSGFTADDLARLDAWEDFDPAAPEASLYRRETMVVAGADGGHHQAEVYRFAQPLPIEAHPIDGGDFAAWLAAQGGRSFGT